METGEKISVEDMVVKESYRAKKGKKTTFKVKE